LRRWVYWQRHLHKSQKLEKWRNKKLSTIKSDWWLSKDEGSNGSSKRDLSESSNIEFTDLRSQKLSKAWWARFKEFKAYLSQTEDNYRKLVRHKHWRFVLCVFVELKFLTYFKDNSLYMWAYQQRLKYKEGKLEADRVDALNSIGFEWKMSKRRRTEVTCDDFTPNRIEGAETNDRPLIGSTFISIHRGALNTLIDGITHEKIDVPEILFHLKQMQHG
jgi:Helicase associated domain